MIRNRTLSIQEKRFKRNLNVPSVFHPDVFEERTNMADPADPTGLE